MLTLDDFDFELPPELIAQHPAQGDRQRHQRKFQQSLMSGDAPQQGNGFAFRQTSNHQRGITVLRNKTVYIHTYV